MIAPVKTIKSGDILVLVYELLHEAVLIKYYHTAVFKKYATTKQLHKITKFALKFMSQTLQHTQNPFTLQKGFLNTKFDLPSPFFITLILCNDIKYTSLTHLMHQKKHCLSCKAIGTVSFFSPPPQPQGCLGVLDEPM